MKNYTSFEPKSSCRFVVTIPNIPEYLICTYYPPQTSKDFITKLITFSCYEPNDISLLRIIQHFYSQNPFTFTIKVNILDKNANTIETHKYTNCYLEDHYYQPFCADNNQQRIVSLTFRYTNLTFDE